MDSRYWGAGYVCLFGVVCLGAVFSLDGTVVRALVGLLGFGAISYGLSLLGDVRGQGDELPDH